MRMRGEERSEEKRERALSYRTMMQQWPWPLHGYAYHGPRTNELFVGHLFAVSDRLHICR
jgi:hypothetical protein